MRKLANLGIYRICSMYGTQIQNMIMIAIVKTMIVPPFDRKFILGLSFPQNYIGKNLMEKETI